MKKGAAVARTVFWSSVGWDIAALNFKKRHFPSKPIPRTFPQLLLERSVPDTQKPQLGKDGRNAKQSFIKVGRELNFPFATPAGSKEETVLLI